MNRHYKGLLLDLSGVLYEGSRTIPGAVDIVKRARAQEFILRFVTNTARRTHQDELQGLLSMGFEVDPKELSLTQKNQPKLWFAKNLLLKLSPKFE